jgi:hypothetical protein
MRRALATLDSTQSPIHMLCCGVSFRYCVVLQYVLYFRMETGSPCRAFDDLNRFPHFTVQQNLYNKEGQGKKPQGRDSVPRVRDTVDASRECDRDL